MAVFLVALSEIFRLPTARDILTELILLLVPLWTSVLIGIFVGWIWRPKWVLLMKEDSICHSESVSEITEQGHTEIHQPNFFSDRQLSISDNREKNEMLMPSVQTKCSSIQLQRDWFMTVDDFDHLCRMVEVKDGGPRWIPMMDKSMPTMSYQAWRRDPDIGPPQYRSRTIFENATPELVRDFFWDDEFRSKWDDMLIHSSTLEKCTETGNMIVHWVRKFPFFCSDREYIIGRRIWESNNSYYCVTKGVPFPSVSRKNKPRRVDVYYSSWCIRAVESRRDGQMTACEVLLFHHEDMGIPWEIAKIGVRQGMWGAVKKIEPGLRAYQKYRNSATPLSHCALMAQICSKMDIDCSKSVQRSTNEPDCETLTLSEKSLGNNLSKFVIVGTLIALACTLDKGLLPKAVIFGVAKRFGKIARKL